jgi:hypothetical protein
MRTFYNRGLVRYAKGNRDGAIADFDEAVRLNPFAALKQRGR